VSREQRWENLDRRHLNATRESAKRCYALWKRSEKGGSAWRKVGLYYLRLLRDIREREARLGQW